MNWSNIDSKTVTVFLAIAVAAFTMGHLIPVINNGYEFGTIIENSHSLKDTKPTQKEIYIMYLMDIDCQYSNNEKIIEKINKLVKVAKKRALDKEFNIKFMLVGLNNPYISTTLLTKFKSVDEINFGNEWQNLSIARYLINEGYTELATPQLLIFKRSNIIQQHGDFKYAYGFKKEKKLYHLTTMDGIINFEFRKIFSNSDKIGLR